MIIDLEDDYEDFDDDGDLDDEMEDIDDDGDFDDEVEDVADDGDLSDEDVADDEHHDDGVEAIADDDEYVPPAPRRSTNPRSLSPVLSAKPRSGGLFSCWQCSCEAFRGRFAFKENCTRPGCNHLYEEHLID
jgi:hypothetical protein